MSMWSAYASHIITRAQPIILSVPIVLSVTIVPGLATVLSVPILTSSSHYSLVRILCSAHFIYFILIFFTFFFGLI